MANQLKPGQEFLANQQITANNGRAFLIMQGDGNFVLYEVHKGKHIPVWASGTDGSGAEKAISGIMAALSSTRRMARRSGNLTLRGTPEHTSFFRTMATR